MGQTGQNRKVSKPEVDKDGLVKRVVELLDKEMEEEVKEVLKPYMGDLAKVSRDSAVYNEVLIKQDEILMEQVCLDCMHRRRGKLR
jgi:hypothetical protein